MRISRSRSLAGDIFQLGNKSYRIQRVERGIVRVEDAHGMAPTISVWLGAEHRGAATNSLHRCRSCTPTRPRCCGAILPGR